MEAGGYRAELLPEVETNHNLAVPTSRKLAVPKKPECIDTVKYRKCRMIVIKWRYDVSTVYLLETLLARRPRVAIPTKRVELLPMLSTQRVLVRAHVLTKSQLRI